MFCSLSCEVKDGGLLLSPLPRRSYVSLCVRRLLFWKKRIYAFHHRNCRGAEMVPYFLTGSMERKPLTALLAGLCLLLVVHFVRGNLGALKHTYLAQEEGITARVVSFEHGNDIALNDEAVKTLDKGEYMDIPTTVNRDAVMTHRPFQKVESRDRFMLPSNEDAVNGRRCCRPQNSISVHR